MHRDSLSSEGSQGAMPCRELPKSSKQWAQVTVKSALSLRFDGIGQNRMCTKEMYTCELMIITKHALVNQQLIYFTQPLLHL
ncbi:hypothetical protein FGO68_gene8957 [Halteria grandinella]|uniref:Uncharacterized protein n=1 Tax=Halteria grandinella TaxID=5974 RepID=A0A8J8NC80_HALGN|nr:hypothetical protein FGO68_gene8957 [Halteria grandinella]